MYPPWARLRILAGPMRPFPRRGAERLADDLSRNARPVRFRRFCGFVRRNACAHRQRLVWAAEVGGSGGCIQGPPLLSLAHLRPSRRDRNPAARLKLNARLRADDDQGDVPIADQALALWHGRANVSPGTRTASLQEMSLRKGRFKRVWSNMGIDEWRMSGGSRSARPWLC